MPWPVWMVETNSRILFLNKTYQQKYKMNLQDVWGKKYEEVFNAETAKIYRHQLLECLKELKPCVFEGALQGSFVECHMFPIIDEIGEVIAVAGIIIDINERKAKEIEIQHQKDILRTIIDAVPEAIFYKDRESRFIGYNKKFGDFYASRGVKQILGKTDLEIYPDDKMANMFIQQDQEIMNNQETKYFEYNTYDRKGQKRIEENIKIPVIDEKGEAWGIVGLSRDITERKQLERRLRYLSEIDILTGLYNRYSFEEKIKELSGQDHMPLGIIMGDINGLKLVNDTLGHLEGDKLIKDMAQVLKEQCHGEGYIFRWGGDEFIILLPQYNEIQCESVIRKIREGCRKYQYPFISLHIALGQTVKTDLNENIYECIKKVEEKVYRQKLLEKKSIKSSILESLTQSLEEKNLETKHHTERVVNYALAMGKRLNLKMDELDELTLVAKLHDIGKICINEQILMKKGSLTSEEFEVMKTHTEKGYRIIQASSELINVAKSVLTHHERWDGKGYPLGLAKKEIPLMARIINVIDSYDVMTHNRIYQKAISREKAIEELVNCAGTQFDPFIVKVFIECLEEML